MDRKTVLLYIWVLVTVNSAAALQHTKQKRSLIGQGGGGFYEYAGGGADVAFAGMPVQTLPVVSNIQAVQQVPLISNIQTVQQVPVISNIQTVQQLPVWQTPRDPFQTGGVGGVGGVAGFGLGGGFKRHRESLIVRGRGFGLGGLGLLGGGRFKVRYVNSGTGGFVGGGGLLGAAGGAGAFGR